MNDSSSLELDSMGGISFFNASKSARSMMNIPACFGDFPDIAYATPPKNVVSVAIDRYSGAIFLPAITYDMVVGCVVW